MPFSPIPDVNPAANMDSKSDTDEQFAVTQKAVDELLLVRKVSCQLGVHTYPEVNSDDYVQVLNLQCRWCHKPVPLREIQERLSSKGVSELDEVYNGMRKSGVVR